MKGMSESRTGVEHIEEVLKAINNMMIQDNLDGAIRALQTLYDNLAMLPEIQAIPWPVEYVDKAGTEAAQAEMNKHRFLRNDQDSRQSIQQLVEEARRRAMARAIHDILIAMLQAADSTVIRKVYVHETI